MTILKNFLWVLCSFCCFNSAALAEPIKCYKLPNTPETFPFYCRGKIGYAQSSDNFVISKSGSHTRFDFRKAQRSSGVDGVNLQPGECTWEDRPIIASEPSSLDIVVANSAPIAQTEQLRSIKDCAQDRECVFEVCAFKYSINIFGATGYQTKILYPFSDR